MQEIQPVAYAVVSSDGRRGQDMKEPRGCIQGISLCWFQCEYLSFLELRFSDCKQSLCSELASLTGKTMTTFCCLMNSGTKSHLAFLFVQAEGHDVHAGREMGNMSSWTVTLPTTRYPQMEPPVVFRRDQDLPVTSCEMLPGYTSSWVVPVLWHAKW